MSTSVKLEVFEGPLDLLLHLIKKNEVSITDIPIATITEQYLATLELMQSLSLDVAGRGGGRRGPEGGVDAPAPGVSAL
ncbi:MAG: hypothetical protein HYW04_09895 [Deltaproteobacteria bacterium]|nr:hypothetical protein [Deltaproteobacteria bacterium]